MFNKKTFESQIISGKGKISKFVSKWKEIIVSPELQASELTNETIQNKFWSCKSIFKYTKDSFQYAEHSSS